MNDLINAAGLLQKQWANIIDTARATAQARAQAGEQLRMFFGSDGAYALNDWKVDVQLKRIYMDLARLLVARLRRLIEAHGPAPDIQLDPAEVYGDEPDYDRGSLEIYMLQRLDHAQTRSLVDLAHQLLARYPLERAKDFATAELAGRVNKIFVPEYQGHPPRHIDDRGRVKVVERPIWQESYERWTVSTKCRQSLYAQVSDMASLLSAQGLPGQVVITRELGDLTRTGKYTSRQKVSCGPGLTLVLFANKLEYQFAPHVLDALQIAVATGLELAVPEAA